jgi:hypothetical protein
MLGRKDAVGKGGLGYTSGNDSFKALRDVQE